MPLYTITTQGGSLSNDAKVELAAKLTALHCEMSGVPKNWVHVIFHDYAAGSGFTAGEPAATVALALLIRTGRSSEYKRELLKRLWGLPRGIGPWSRCRRIQKLWPSSLPGFRRSTCPRTS